MDAEIKPHQQIAQATCRDANEGFDCIYAQVTEQEGASPVSARKSTSAAGASGRKSNSRSARVLPRPSVRGSSSNCCLHPPHVLQATNDAQTVFCPAVTLGETLAHPAAGDT